MLAHGRGGMCGDGQDRQDGQDGQEPGRRWIGAMTCREKTKLCVSVPLWLLFSVFSRPSVSAQPASITFKDVAPIVWRRCATCHRPGEIGPFSLLTYDDVKRHATQIADVTSRRVMPPWKPSAANDFQDNRRLTDAELLTLQQWIGDGAIEGNSADLPPAPSWSAGWQLGTPDLVVTMPDEYVVGGDRGGGVLWVVVEN